VLSGRLLIPFGGATAILVAVVFVLHRVAFDPSMSPDRVQPVVAQVEDSPAFANGLLSISWAMAEAESPLPGATSSIPAHPIWLASAYPAGEIVQSLRSGGMASGMTFPFSYSVTKYSRDGRPSGSGTVTCHGTVWPMCRDPGQTCRSYVVPGQLLTPECLLIAGLADEDISVRVAQHASGYVVTFGNVKQQPECPTWLGWLPGCSSFMSPSYNWQLAFYAEGGHVSSGRFIYSA
jgi:hypothetical protein